MKIIKRAARTNCERAKGSIVNEPRGPLFERAAGINIGRAEGTNTKKGPRDKYWKGRGDRC
jgi:hypothetical protein